jgi:hypothetical protein
LLSVNKENLYLVAISYIFERKESTVVLVITALGGKDNIKVDVLGFLKDVSTHGFFLLFGYYAAF